MTSVARLAKLRHVASGHPAEHQSKELGMRGGELEITDLSSPKPLLSIGGAFLVGEHRRAKLPKGLGGQGCQQGVLVLEVPVGSPGGDAQLALNRGLA